MAVVGLALAGAASYFFMSTGKPTVVIDDEMFHQVEVGDFIHDVVEQGEVESARNVDVISQVRGTRESNSFEILWVIEEGKVVQEGDVLVRLDSSGLDEEAKLQELDLSGSQAGLAKAQNTLDAAQIAMTEYVDGLFVQEVREIEAEITFAKETLKRAQEYFHYSSRLAAKGYVTSLQLEGDEFAVEKASTELANAEHKLKVLRENTKLKKIKELQSSIGVAQADLRSAEERNGIEQKRLDFIREQIENCTIRAPASGQVVYANERGNREASEFIVEPGATVRERQSIIRLPDYSAMQVHVLINESRVSLVDAGMPATITLDAFDKMTLRGKVIKVNEYPEPISRFGPQVKRYAAVIEIEEPPKLIKPGLTANVAIHVESLQSVVQVPVQCVMPHGDHYYCMVRNGEEIEPRQVEVGSNNSRFVVINSGLKANDLVSLSPRRLLDVVTMPEVTPGEKPVRNLQDGDSPKGPGGSGGPGREGRPGGPGRRGPDSGGPGGRPSPGERPTSPGEQDTATGETQLADRVSKQAEAENDGSANQRSRFTNGRDDSVRVAEDQPTQPVGGAQ
ncbi:efflux RND transporter periplasmic adaptor subunit [Blastopirellula marina]|uniref:efflux RND transporter periplasmic adaptor subunit n=1 Tax=Blastopirellula marina TaxID=124 RepID=UPI001304F3CB|nr:HlyD family efflux transporter periplasmic adaptor subunit [Blastopirellula marina]